MVCEILEVIYIRFYIVHHRGEYQKTFVAPSVQATRKF